MTSSNRVLIGIVSFSELVEGHIGTAKQVVGLRCIIKVGPCPFSLISSPVMSYSDVLLSKLEIRTVPIRCGLKMLDC